MNKFNKIYLSIINENIETNPQYIFKNKYNTVEKYYWKEHVEQRNEQRYFNKYNLEAIDIIINECISDLNAKDIWNTKVDKIKGRGFTFHAKWSDIWISGRMYVRDGIKKLYISTLLPLPNPKPHPDDYVLEIDI